MRRWRQEVFLVFCGRYDDWKAMGSMEGPNTPLYRLPDSWINQNKINIAEFQIRYWRETMFADALLLNMQ